MCSSDWNKKLFSALQEKVAQLHEWVPLGLTTSHFLPQRKDTSVKADGCAVQTKGISPTNTALLSRVLQMLIRKRCSWWLSAFSQSLLHQNNQPFLPSPCQKPNTSDSLCSPQPFLSIPPSLQKITLNSGS